MQKEFLKGWWQMIRQKHGVSFSNALWFISLLLFVLTIVGLFTLDIKSAWRTLSWVLFGLICVLYFWHLFIQIPSEMFQKVKEDSKKLLKIESIQKQH